MESPKFPLDAYGKNTIFKLFSADVGLLGAQSNLLPKIIIEGDALFTESKGAIAENYVVQEPIATKHKPVYYRKSGGTAEIDFLLEEDLAIYPLYLISKFPLKAD